MTLKLSTVAVLILVVLCSTSRTTSAQPYATLAAGGAFNDVDCTNYPTCEKNDVAFKLLGGYRLAPWIAGEAVYVDFGAARKTAPISENSYGTSAFGGGVAFRGNFGSWSLTGRVGAASVASEIVVTFTTANSPSPNPITTHKLMPYGGAELGYRFSKYVALAVGLDVTKARWENGPVVVKWNAGAVTAGLTIGR